MRILQNRWSSSRLLILLRREWSSEQKDMRLWAVNHVLLPSRGHRHAEHPPLGLSHEPRERDHVLQVQWQLDVAVFAQVIAILVAVENLVPDFVYEVVVVIKERPCRTEVVDLGRSSSDATHLRL